MNHEPHCPVPRAEARGEGAVCMCTNESGSASYTYLDQFFAVWESGARTTGESVECRKLHGKPFQFLRVIPESSEGPEDPPEDLHVCRFDNDFEMACYAEEVVAAIDGQDVAVNYGGVVVRRGHKVLKTLEEMAKIAAGGNDNCLAGMQCPECESREPFVISAGCQVEMWDAGSEHAFEFEWDKNSWVMCKNCGHGAKAKEFGWSE